MTELVIVMRPVRTRERERNRTPASWRPECAGTAARWTGSGTAKVHSVDAVPGGQQRNELVERPPRLRESVHQEHRDALVSCGGVVQLCAVHCRSFVPGTGDGCLFGIHERLLKSHEVCDNQVVISGRDKRDLLATWKRIGIATRR
jgi:hypothetical protein